MPAEHIDINFCFTYAPVGKTISLSGLRVLVGGHCKERYGGIPGLDNPSGIRKLAVVVERGVLSDPEQAEFGPIDFLAGDQSVLVHDPQDWFAPHRGLDELHLLLNQKIYDDQPNRREKTHVSKHPGPKKFVDEETPIFYVGSIGFLSLVAFTVLEWREKRVIANCLGQLAVLEKVPDPGPEVFPAFHMVGKETWAGFSNATLATPEELSGGKVSNAELVRRLGKRPSGQE